EHDAAAQRAMVLLEDLEHAGQGGPEVERGGQRPADLQQVGELADLGGVVAGPRLPGADSSYGIGAQLCYSSKIVCHCFRPARARTGFSGALAACTPAPPWSRRCMQQEPGPDSP